MSTVNGFVYLNLVIISYLLVTEENKPLYLPSHHYKIKNMKTTIPQCNFCSNPIAQTIFLLPNEPKTSMFLKKTNIIPPKNKQTLFLQHKWPSLPPPSLYSPCLCSFVTLRAAHKPGCTILPHVMFLVILIPRVCSFSSLPLGVQKCTCVFIFTWLSQSKHFCCCS